MDAQMDFYDNSTHLWDNVTYNNNSVGIQMISEGFYVRFIFQGVLLTCVTIFGLVSNVIAIIVLLRLVNCFGII